MRLPARLLLFLCFVLIAGTALISVLRRPPGTRPEMAVPVDSTDELWYRQAIIYTLDVEVFRDADGDGTGDFNGLTQELDYLDSLGVDVLWLSPFQPTPNRDDGYDVSDYYTIDPRLGTMADFRRFMQEAERRHIRVIMDLIVNHTSDRHPWFLQARSNARSPYRYWYVWSEKRPANYDRGMVFPGVQRDIWTYDTLAGAYYYHRFYDFQPDLNTQNPQVRAEITRIMQFWTRLGLYGFRLDAVPFYIEVPQKKGEHFPRQYTLLNDMRRALEREQPHGFILGEANVLPEEQKHFFGEHGERMNMMFNFYVNQHLFYSLASGEVKELRRALGATAGIPRTAQWAQFLRNHDELDLGRLSDRRRQQVYDRMGPDSNMQLYGRGIRRRLAPMLGNDRRWQEMAYSLLLALPGTPVLRYGDEIGMGDDLRLPERLSVRTPMQWSGQANGGFTSSLRPVRPVISEGPFSYRSVNVAAQLRDTGSLLQHIRRLIRLRKSCPAISYGYRRLPETGNPHVLAISYVWQGRTILLLHNFSPAPQSAELHMPGKMRLKDLLTETQPDTCRHGCALRLDGYGYRWLELIGR